MPFDRRRGISPHRCRSATHRWAKWTIRFGIEVLQPTDESQDRLAPRIHAPRGQSMSLGTPSCSATPSPTAGAYARRTSWNASPQEIRRREQVIRIFPNAASVERLIGALAHGEARDRIHRTQVLRYGGLLGLAPASGHRRRLIPPARAMLHHIPDLTGRRQTTSTLSLIIFTLPRSIFYFRLP